MGTLARWQLRRVWRLTVFVGTFFVLVYFGFNEVHGENSLAAWLILVGAIAVCLVWAKVWPEPEPED
jgi:hypothetical protein